MPGTDMSNCDPLLTQNEYRTMSYTTRTYHLHYTEDVSGLRPKDECGSKVRISAFIS